jgi:long-chain acyl-CoA synthetase
MLPELTSRLTGHRAFHIGLMFHEAAAQHGTAPVLLDQPLQLAPDEGLDHTRASLAGLTDELTAALAEAGVGAGHRVAIFKTSNFDIALLASAVSRLGAVPAMIAPPLSGQVVSTLLRRLDDPWLISDGDHFDQAWPGGQPGAPVRGVLLSAGTDGTPRPGTTALGRVRGAPAREPALPRPDQPAMITHSSGTTGVPKLAVHTPNTLWNRLVPQKLMAWPIRGRETAALCMTFVHSRFYNALRVFLGYGNPLLIAADHHPDQIGPLFARLRPGYVETHPNTYIEWEDLADAPGRPLGNVRVFGSTFDAAHPRTIQRLLGGSRRRVPLFVQLYGESETGPVTARWFTRAAARRGDTRSVGYPLPGFTRVRVTGPDNAPAGRGQTGMIEAQTRALIRTYLGEEDRYADELNDGWWRMGDMGQRRSWGRVYLMDREIDQIDTMPSNLHAEDVVLERLPELRELVIVADAAGQPVPVVCTRDEAPLDQERWQRATGDLDPMADPVQLPFEQLPRTSTEKVQRSELTRLMTQPR